jgi:hypothetical protein
MIVFYLTRSEAEVSTFGDVTTNAIREIRLTLKLHSAARFMYCGLNLKNTYSTVCACSRRRVLCTKLPLFGHIIARPFSELTYTVIRAGKVAKLDSENAANLRGGTTGRVTGNKLGKRNGQRVDSKMSLLIQALIWLLEFHIQQKLRNRPKEKRSRGVFSVCG